MSYRNSGIKQYLALIPNILSTLRLGLACLFPFCPEELWVWLILGSGASDFLDGWCARRWKVSSWQGGLLDAVADKMFMFAALTTVAMTGKFPIWWILAVIARDLTVGIAAAYAATIQSWASFREMGARWSGKLATAGQFLLLLTVVLFPGMAPVALFISVSCSVFAAGDYGLLFYQALHRQHRDKNSSSR
ncbi:MAG: CDP-alcohol phosphatidyltransferase family protein [Proteobacteria bacterium]|nr:CDP-alcohol phosphatidyltransferase family protein [Pseudomonadota bacterium]